MKVCSPIELYTVLVHCEQKFRLCSDFLDFLIDWKLEKNTTKNLRFSLYTFNFL